MFVRKKKNKSGSISIQIIQKANRNNRIIKTIGSSRDPQEIERLYLHALHELPRLYGPTLFDTVKTPLISDISNDSIRIIGPDIIFGKIFDYIGFNTLKEPLLKHLVVSRITHPGSKLKLANYLSAIGEKPISVYSIYRFMDKLDLKLKDKIEEISYRYTKRLLGGVIEVVFYDVTTIYFEASEADDYRIAGFSKDGKHQHPQILLGLLVGKDGYPLGYEIFEGNTFEGNTLVSVIQRYLNKFKIEKPIIVADSGLLSKKNIESLIENGFKFILGARIKNEKKNIIDKILNLKLKDGEIKAIQNGDGFTIHIGFSDKRARKDKFNRERGIKKLEKSILTGKLTKSNINNRGYNKYLKMDGQIAVSIDKDKIHNDARWDGLKGYITNTNLSSKEIIANYNNLWKIEKAFRISKTDLKVRPVYHRLRRRVEAHICISFMAYLVYKELERVLNIETKGNISINQAIEQINKMYGITINDSYNQKISLKNNDVQESIIKIVNQYF